MSNNPFLVRSKKPHTPSSRPSINKIDDEDAEEVFTRLAMVIGAFAAALLTNQATREDVAKAFGSESSMDHALRILGHKGAREVASALKSNASLVDIIDFGDVAEKVND